MLSDATRLLALVSAPSLETASIRHIEVLQAAADDRDGRRDHLDGRRDEAGVPARGAGRPGARRLGGEYLEEQLVGERLGSRTVRRRLEAPELVRRERAFLALIGQTLLEVGAEAGPEVFVGGTAGLVGGARPRSSRRRCGSSSCLERRAAVLELVSEALEPQRPVVHVGPEVGGAELHAVSLVGATYGIRSTPLGAVGLVGPLRMDYEKAIRTVRAAAFELSRFVEDVYEDV